MDFYVSTSFIVEKTEILIYHGEGINFILLKSFVVVFGWALSLVYELKEKSRLRSTDTLFLRIPTHASNCEFSDSDTKIFLT